MSEFLFRVGDEFQGNPSQMNKFMHMIFQAGGKVRIDGDRAIITYLPPIVEEPEPVVEEPIVEEPVVEEPVVEEPVVEEPVVEEPEAPKRRRSRKTVIEETVEESEE